MQYGTSTASTQVRGTQHPAFNIGTNYTLSGASAALAYGTTSIGFFTATTTGLWGNVGAKMQESPNIVTFGEGNATTSLIVRKHLC